MNQDLLIIVGLLAVYWSLAALAIGHMTYRWELNREYPVREGEAGIRYILRTLGIAYYYGLVQGISLFIAAGKQTVSGTRWLLFGKNTGENDG